VANEQKIDPRVLAAKWWNSVSAVAWQRTIEHCSEHLIPGD
jgi:hypothetical protein